MESTKNLIAAMAEYGMNHCWNDNDIIETLIDCGVTEDDFKACGYGEFVSEYFRDERGVA